MLRRLLIVVALAAGAASNVAQDSVGGTSSTPVVGDWPFCATDNQVGCIEYFSFEDANGSMREYEAFQEAQNAGIGLNVRCYGSSMTDGDPCVPRTASGASCGSAGMNFQISVNPTPRDENDNPRDGSVFVDRLFVARVRTGDIDPVFAMGGRIESTTRANLPSGLFTFEVTGRIQKTHSVDTSGVTMLPHETYRARLSSFLKTSRATGTSYGAGVSVYPASFLKSTSVDLNGLCVDMPFVGAYADANGMGFTTSWKPTKPSDPVVSTIEMEVAGPHFLPDSNGNDNKLVPARIRFFLPNEFFSRAGYDDPTEFDASRLVVTTRDGQSSQPTLTRKADGVLVDFGIKHYSAPDPTLKIYRKGATPTVTPVAESTTGTSSPTAVAAKAPTVKVGRTYSTTSLVQLSKLSRSKGSRVTLKVERKSAKVCRATTKGVKAIKAGTCRVKVTVTKKGTTSKSRTVSIAVRR